MEGRITITTIKQTLEENRPYEKFLAKGPEALTDSELLAIVIRTGSRDQSSVSLSEGVLKLSKNGIAGLSAFSVRDLMKLKGIGKVKAIQILCIAELSKRIAKADISPKTEFISPEMIANYYMEDMRHLKTEHVVIVMLNTKHMLIGDYELSKGTVNSSAFSPREAYIEALKADAVYIVMIHNHPSGDPTPSREDLMATRRMKEAGFMIGIPLIDHIIIGDHQFVSLKQQGLL